MLRQISVLHILENGVEIPENHDFSSRQEWNWSKHEKGIRFWSKDLESGEIDDDLFIRANPCYSYRMFEIDEYIVILRKNALEQVHLYMMWPYL